MPATPRRDSRRRSRGSRRHVGRLAPTFAEPPPPPSAPASSSRSSHPPLRYDRHPPILDPAIEGGELIFPPRRADLVTCRRLDCHLAALAIQSAPAQRPSATEPPGAGALWVQVLDPVSLPILCRH